MYFDILTNLSLFQKLTVTASRMRVATSCIYNNKIYFLNILSIIIIISKTIATLSKNKCAKAGLEKVTSYKMPGHCLKWVFLYRL